MKLNYLKPGNLLKLNDSNLICWFSNSKADFILPRLKIGSLRSYEDESSNFKEEYYSNFYLLYLGLDSLYRDEGVIRQLRLVYIDKKIGYIECYDLKYLTTLE